MKKVLFLIVMLALTIGYSVQGGNAPPDIKSTNVFQFDQATTVDMVFDFSALNFATDWQVLIRQNETGKAIMEQKVIDRKAIKTSFYLYQHPLMCYIRHKRVKKISNNKQNRKDYSQVGYSIRITSYNVCYTKLLRMPFV